MKTNLEDEEDSDEDDDDFDYDETALESFVTPLDDDDTSPDEYQIFRTVYDGVQAENPPWFQKLASGLNDDNFKSIQEVFKLGEQRLAAKRSKNIEKAGGSKLCRLISWNLYVFKTFYHFLQAINSNSSPFLDSLILHPALTTLDSAAEIKKQRIKKTFTKNYILVKTYLN